MTGDAGSEAGSARGETRGPAYLQKPFYPETLGRVLRSVLGLGEAP